MKVCKGCRKLKEHSEFSPNGVDRKFRQRYRATCKQCESERQEPIRNEKPNRERYSKERLKGYQVKHAFGMTYEEWEALMESRGWACEICGRVVESSGRTLAVDHCHATGDVRGVLCQRCNCAIGLLSEDTTHINNAIEYLRRSKCVPLK